MPTPFPQQGILLLLGPPRTRWPEPLATLLHTEKLAIQPINSMHEAAEHVAGGNRNVRGLLMDPRVLMLRDLEAVRPLTRYVQMPIVLLPLDQGASPRARE